MLICLIGLGNSTSRIIHLKPTLFNGESYDLVAKGDGGSATGTVRYRSEISYINMLYESQFCGTDNVYNKVQMYWNGWFVD